MLYLRNIKETEQLRSSLEELVRSAGVLKYREAAHRQYLSYDVGPGTYSERERRHRQLRLDQAIDSVFERQRQKSLESNKDKAMLPHTLACVLHKNGGSPRHWNVWQMT